MMELEKIKEIVSGLMSRDVSEVTEHTRFFKDLGMDSLDVFQLVVEVEAYFGIDIAEGAIERLATVGDAAELVKSLA
ncbi:MAG: phosphopantetheine-binding protein [Defluviitaleaceae bacterium]|nr:phosphopantetheine-binding protein [Defluviitaleaceae bacterium]MCL2836590.1 phosphopantetheine-binding protein [Defluviitaleaceae bacterium]